MALLRITTKTLEPDGTWAEIEHPSFTEAGKHGLQSMMRGCTDMRTYQNGEEISNEIFFAEMQKELDAGMQ